MSTDPFKSYQNTPTHFLDGETEAASLRKVDARIQEHASVSSKRRILKWLSMAAMVLVVFFTGRYFISTDTNDLAAHYFEAYPNYQSIATRGSGQDEHLSNAFQAYDKGDFNVSVALFMETEGLSSAEKLYYAIALQGRSDWDASLRILNEVRGDLPVEYIPAGEWYYAIGLIGVEQVNEAIPILKTIVDGRSSFVEKAVALLQDLE